VSVLDPACAGLLPLLPEREDAPALRDEQTAKWITRGEVRRQALAVAAALNSPRKGLVFLLVSNRSATVTGLLGAAAAGHAVAPIDHGLDPSKVQALFDAYDPDFILSAAPISGLTARRVADDAVWLATLEAKDHTPIAADLLLLPSTSGTTGSSKFVRLSQGAVRSNARQIAQALGITDHDVGIGHLPLHYSYGLSVVTSHFACGAGVFLMDDALTGSDFWPKVHEAGGTHFPGVPFHYTVLARLGLGQVPPSVTTFTQAGGALDVHLQQKLQSGVAARGGRFFVMYGQTEAAPRMTTLPNSRFAAKIGSVGVALDQARLEIHDETGRRLPPNETGTVHFYGPNVMQGYALSRSDLGGGDELHGHLDTGDLGYLDSEGYLFISGRTQRFAKIAGLRLGLDEIEAQIAPIASIAALDQGEKISIFFEAGGEADLKAKLKAMAADYKILPASFVLHAVDALPRKASGKIDYARLKKLDDV
jgi:acyl-coenzyme A synthetase/AMP-(fatty) acid ligase